MLVGQRLAAHYLDTALPAKALAAAERAQLDAGLFGGLKQGGALFNLDLSLVRQESNSVGGHRAISRPDATPPTPAERQVYPPVYPGETL